MGESTEPPRCRTCHRTADEIPLLACTICYKPFCRDCAHGHSGRLFCSQHCAEYYFFADPDDEDS